MERAVNTEPRIEYSIGEVGEGGAHPETVMLGK